MQGTVHLLVGAAIALLFPDPVVFIPIALFSHYALDLVPHIDPETFVTYKRPYSWKEFVSLVLDVILVIGFMVAFYMSEERRGQLLIGGIVAQLPDLLTPLEHYSFFYPMHAFHDLFHWEPKRAKRWSWYIAGLIAPAVTGLCALYIILTV